VDKVRRACPVHENRRRHPLRPGERRVRAVHEGVRLAPGTRRTMIRCSRRWAVAAHKTAAAPGSATGTSTQAVGAGADQVDVGATGQGDVPPAAARVRQPYSRPWRHAPRPVDGDGPLVAGCDREGVRAPVRPGAGRGSVPCRDGPLTTPATRSLRSAARAAFLVELTTPLTTHARNR
jgi:hypothetical protein